MDDEFIGEITPLSILTPHFDSQSYPQESGKVTFVDAANTAKEKHFIRPTFHYAVFAALTFWIIS